MNRMTRDGGGRKARRSPGRRRLVLLAAATGIMATVTMTPPASATVTVAPPVAVPAKLASRAATLKLVVKHTMDGGRLILKLEDRAILSAPLSALRSGDGRPCEHSLSVPGGYHALTVQMLDVRGRIVGEGIIHGLVEAAKFATLVIAEHRDSGAGLTLSWRTP